MKKYFVTLICITFVLLTGCSTSQIEFTQTNNENINVQTNNKKSPYLKKLDYFGQDVTEVIDSETGVHYFILNEDKCYGGSGGICPRYNADGTLYRPEPTEEVINEFMEYKGITDRNVALQYFNKTCCECGKNVRQNDVLAMNLKMNGRNTNKIYCKKCLIKKLGMSKEEWDNNVADFKAQGCVLF